MGRVDEEVFALRMRSTGGFAVVDLLFVCGIIGIVSGIALPRLVNARGSAQAASAIGSLRVIGSAQVTFAVTCGAGFYAPSLTGLGKPPAGSNAAFISGDMSVADSIVKSAYTFQMGATAFGGAPDTCNALGVGLTGQAFRAAADPLDVVNNHRYFAINAGETIWEDKNSLWAAMPEFGDAPSGAPIKN